MTDAEHAEAIRPAVRWCNSCQMDPNTGCRLPLGADLCPYADQRIAFKKREAQEQKVLDSR